jgi:hypothetical protein
VAELLRQELISGDLFVVDISRFEFFADAIRQEKMSTDRRHSVALSCEIYEFDDTNLLTGLVWSDHRENVSAYISMIRGS